MQTKTPRRLVAMIFLCWGILMSLWVYLADIFLPWYMRALDAMEVNKQVQPFFEGRILELLFVAAIGGILSLVYFYGWLHRSEHFQHPKWWNLFVIFLVTLIFFAYLIQPIDYPSIGTEPTFPKQILESLVLTLPACLCALPVGMFSALILVWALKKTH